MKKIKVKHIIIGIVSIVALFILWKVINIPPFANKAWVDKNDTSENLSFGVFGGFAYWCSCGNPVDGSDMVEYYTYNRFTKKIKLIWHDDNNKKRVEVYDVIKYTDEKLVLRIDGERTEFILDTYSH